MIFHFSFYGIFTYITFRLHGPPYHLTVAQIGFIFLVYTTGMLIPPFFGKWSEKTGLVNLMRFSIFFSIVGIGFTLSSNLILIIVGLMLFTGGHFSAHSAASSWVSGKVNEGRGVATSLYLVSYYTGGSIGAYVLGILCAWGWSAVATILMILLSIIYCFCILLQKADRRISLD